MAKRRREKREHLRRRKVRLRRGAIRKVRHRSACRSMLRVKNDALMGVDKAHFLDGDIELSPTP